MSNLYQDAARLKIRFPTAKGELTVEDLFDLPLQSNTGKVSLDNIAGDLYRKISTMKEIVSFVDDTKAEYTSDSIAFEIVKDVIAIKKAERNARATEAANKEAKQKIMAIIERKSDEALGSKSIEELQAELAKL